MANAIKNIISKANFEALFWISGLVLLFFTNPHSESHFTICPFALLGWDFCPGCGLGRSISCIFHGEFAESFHFHPLGFFALAVLLHRIYILLTPITKIKNKNYGPEPTIDAAQS